MDNRIIQKPELLLGSIFSQIPLCSGLLKHLTCQKNLKGACKKKILGELLESGACTPQSDAEGLAQGAEKGFN